MRKELKYKFTKYSKEHFAMFGINKDDLPREELYQNGWMSEQEKRDYLSDKENRYKENILNYGKNIF